MPPKFAIICLILGLTGVILFVVSFSLPYWFVDTNEEFVLGATPEEYTVSHGLWKTKECQDGKCLTKTIGFGVSSEFESGRVFSCATVAMCLVSFCFTVVLVQSPKKVWSTRCSAVWSCAAIFNLLALALIGGSEKKTLEELELPGVDPEENIATKLGWCFWIALASLAIFVLLTVSCGVLSCTDQVIGNDKTSSGNKLLKKRTLKRTEKEMQADRLARLELDRSEEYPHPSGYPNMHTYQPTSLGTDSAKTSGIVPAVHAPVNQPSVYSVNKTSSGYAIQPSSAAVNIDNRSGRLTALDTPYHPPKTSVVNHATTGVYTAQIRDESLTERVVLNKPNMSTTVSTTQEPSRNLYPSLGHMKTDDTSSAFQERSTGQSLIENGFTVASSSHSGPPSYTTFPRPRPRSVDRISSNITMAMEY